MPYKSGLRDPREWDLSERETQLVESVFGTAVLPTSLFRMSLTEALSLLERLFQSIRFCRNSFAARKSSDRPRCPSAGPPGDLTHLSRLENPLTLKLPFCSLSSRRRDAMRRAVSCQRHTIQDQKPIACLNCWPLSQPGGRHGEGCQNNNMRSDTH